MMMLTAKNKQDLPPLYANEAKETPLADQVIVVKFFQPWGQWTWYAVEGSQQADGDWLFFGYVVGLEAEWGYFSLNELTGIRGPAGLKIERDRYFKPVKFSECSEIARKVAA